MLKTLYRQYADDARASGKVPVSFKRFLEAMGAEELGVEEWKTRRAEKIEQIKKEKMSAEKFLEGWKVDEEGKVRAGELYDLYRKWCEQDGRRPISRNKFGRKASDIVGQAKMMRIGKEVFRGYEIRQI